MDFDDEDHHHLIPMLVQLKEIPAWGFFNTDEHSTWQVIFAEFTSEQMPKEFKTMVWARHVIFSQNPSLYPGAEAYKWFLKDQLVLPLPQVECKTRDGESWTTSWLDKR